MGIERLVSQRIEVKAIQLGSGTHFRVARCQFIT
jgi:hypothetical protein